MFLACVKRQRYRLIAACNRNETRKKLKHESLDYTDRL